MEPVRGELQPGRKETQRGSSCSLSVKLKGTFKNIISERELLTVIAVQLNLPQFRYFWECVELMGDAIRQHSVEVSRHKISLSK